MRAIAVMILLVCFKVGYGQPDPTELAQPIVAEGKILYRSEMASWYGTDLFLEKFKQTNTIGGYFFLCKS